MVTLLGVRLGNSYGVLSGQFLCFNSKYSIEFSVSNSSLYLKISENEKFISNFYGDSISNITAIVGKNGVGKSTLLRYIKDLFVREKNELKFREDDILIFQDNNKLKVYFNEHRKGNLSIINETGLAIEEKYYRGYPKIFDQIKNLTTVFYSNSLELEQIETETTNYFNISTGYLLENIGKINSKLRNKRVRNQNAHSRFRFTELKRQLSFFRSLDNSLTLVDIPFRRINELELEVREVTRNDYKKLSTSLERELFQSQSDRRKNPRMVPEIFSVFFSWFSDTIEQFRDEGDRHKKYLQSSEPEDYIHVLVVENLVLALLAVLIEDIYEILNEPSNYGQSYFNIIQRSIRLADIKSFYSTNRLNDELRPMLEDLRVALDSITMSKQIEKKIDRFEELSQFESFIFPLMEAGRVSKNSVLFDTNNPVIENMINQYFSSSMDFKFVKFNWPKLSAGEESLIAFFSRLHTIANDSRTENLLLLIDEGDLYFHPEWQRKYMYFLINFLSSGYVDFGNIQLILTTHSPFIVSDLTESDIIFLNREQDKVSIIDPEEFNLKTFGGNLHTLYARAFFLGPSTISEFALNKIRHSIVDEIEKPSEEINTEMVKRLINEIGEPVLRSALNDRLNKKINDPNKSMS